METHSKNFENLIKNSLDEFKDEVSDKIWKNLDKKLSYMNFLKLSFTNFNIYYLTSLIIFGASSMIVVLNNSNSTVVAKPCIINVKIDSSTTKENETININETYKEQTNNSENEILSTNNNEVKCNNKSLDESIIKREEKVVLNTFKNDTTANLNQEATIENDVANEKKVIKRISIQKKIKIKSTITQIDSVEIIDKKKIR